MRIDKSKNEWNKLWFSLPWLLLIPLAIWLSNIAQNNPWFVEKYYSSGIYPYISAVMGAISSIFTFSLAEIIVYLLALVLIVGLIVHVIFLLISKIHIATFLRYFVSLGITFGILLNLFYWFWGFNYSRPNLYELMNLPIESRSADELESLCHSLAETAVELREKLSEDADGVFKLDGDYRDYFKRLPSAYTNLGNSVSLFFGRTYAAKGVLSSVGMSYAGISGIYIPHTAEANVNIDQTPLLLLSTAAHEMAHFSGIAREDEANFVAYLVCIYSTDPAIRYSGVMLALINCSNKLYAADAEKHYNLYMTYSDGMRRDLNAHSEYWDNFEGPTEEVATTLNDNYLKFNHQEEGAKSYGMMVDLLLAYYSEGFSLPSA